MRFSTTDGRVWDAPDMCGCCQLDTAGNHQPHCPLSQPIWFKSTQSDAEPRGIGFPQESFNQTLKRIMKEHKETLDKLS